MITAWGIYSGMLGHANRIFNLIIQFLGFLTISLEKLNVFDEKICDNYEKLQYKKEMDLFRYSKFVKRKWLLFFADGPGSTPTKAIFEPGSG